MRRLFCFMIPALILSGMIAVFPFFDGSRELTEDVMRIHIRANSDSAADQSLKLAVRDRVLRECSAYFEGCSSKDDALKITRERLEEIERAAQSEIRERGWDYPVKAEIGRSYFNTRRYDDFTMPAGWYDSLKLTIGSGGGENWWCVMYPALCVGAACRDTMKEDLSAGEYRVVTSDRLDFRFKLVEYWEGFLNLFR